MEKLKMANILEMVNRRAKRSGIWESWVLVEYIWGVLDLIVFKVILKVIWCTCNFSENMIVTMLLLLHLCFFQSIFPNI